MFIASSTQRYALGWLAATAAVACLLQASASSIVGGIVRDESGPVAGASVGWQGRCERVVTDSSGRFRLPGANSLRRLTASKPGYRIASSEESDSLKLIRLPTDDNLEYAWIDPHPDRTQPNNCA